MLKKEITDYLKYLSKIYDELQGPPLEIAICGGAALNLLNLVERTTKDIDLVSPKELPGAFNEATKITANYFDLKQDWINQGPVDLLTLGLPKGFFDRAEILKYSKLLQIFLTSRFDQIHFKLYASVDRGGYHVQDLQALQPKSEELIKAANWCFTHDVSEPFRVILIDFLNQQGWKDAVKKLA